jgi:hypothetical protein
MEKGRIEAAAARARDLFVRFIEERPRRNGRAWRWGSRISPNALLVNSPTINLRTLGGFRTINLRTLGGFRTINLRTLGGFRTINLRTLGGFRTSEPPYWVRSKR